FFHRLIYHTLADGIIVNAEKIKRTLLLSPFIDAGTTKVIHNGVDNLNIDSLAEIPASKPFPFVVVAVGVLTDRKGFDFLMNGFAAFTRNHPNINPGLIIMGDGPKKDELQKLAVKLGIENRTVFTGFVDNPYRYMTIGDVIAMTSKNEGISNALIEGMYLGNVPVSTFAGGSEELIMDGRNGFLVEYGDSGRLEGVLSELAENREIRKRLSSAAKETVKAGFSLDVMQREMIDFCRSIKDAE
ncbi:MAG: glycosyltransferase, partial [Chlorobiaceae bacterium]|nr:glycosyltransferase [Chlorobiaceae bacterium]